MNFAFDKILDCILYSNKYRVRVLFKDGANERSEIIEFNSFPTQAEVETQAALVATILNTPPPVEEE